MELEKCSVEALISGYRYLEEEHRYECLTCGEFFEDDEVYLCDEHFYLAEKAVKYHIKIFHPEYCKDAIHNVSKYNTLTDNQKNLLELFAAGYSDKEIAKHLDISISTVRHQKFMFREKAKQAKLYLSIYESVFMTDKTADDSMMPIHDHAKMVDMRYVITEEERKKVIDTYFSSLSPLVLKELPAREKKKLIILAKICEQFENSKKYTEQEINGILKLIYHDFPSVRRYLIQYGFMKREQDGTHYWRT